MAAYHAELLDAAERLLAREPRQTGRLPSARIRRSISTCYYAIFHFLLDDASRRLVGNQDRHRRRRRILARNFTHAGIKMTLSKIRSLAVDRSLDAFVRHQNIQANPMQTPPFARLMAAVFADAQTKRHNADYDLNVSLNEVDARALRTRCRDAIQGWQSATNPDERDFKDALAIVMLLKGQLRKDD